jgi:hypothetical protein
LEQCNPQRSQPKEELIKAIFVCVYGHPIVNHYKIESVLLFKKPPEKELVTLDENRNEIQCFFAYMKRLFDSVIITVQEENEDIHYKDIFGDFFISLLSSFIVM